MPLVFLSNFYLDKLSNKSLLIIILTAFLAGLLIRGINMSIGLTIAATVLTKHLPGMLYIMVNMKIVSTIVEEKLQVLALTLVYTAQSLASVICVNVAGRILVDGTYSGMFLLFSAPVFVAVVLVLFFRIPKGNERALFN